MFVSPDVWEKTMRGVCQLSVRAWRWPPRGRGEGYPSHRPLNAAYHVFNTFTSRNTRCCTNTSRAVRATLGSVLITAQTLVRARTILALSFTLMACYVTQSFAQSPKTAGAATVPEPTPAPLRAELAPAHDPTAPPLPDQTMRIYRSVESWIRAWQVPTKGLADAADTPRDSAIRGACVTLRFAGEVVGRGESIVGDDVVATATRAAMTAAESKLPIPPRANAQDQARKLAPEIAISLELAGALTPFEPATWEEAELALAPGLEGVCVTPPVANAALRPPPPRVMFPSQMLLTNLLPHRAISTLASQVIGEGGAAAVLDQPKIIIQRHGLRFSRFRVTHLAQPSPGQPPVLLFRGQRVVPWQSAMTRAELEAFGRRIAHHLLKRLTDEGPAKLAKDDPARLLAIFACQTAQTKGIAWSTAADPNFLRMLNLRDEIGKESPKVETYLKALFLAGLTAEQVGLRGVNASPDADVGYSAIDHADLLIASPASDLHRTEQLLSLNLLARVTMPGSRPERWKTLIFRNDRAALRARISEMFASAAPGTLVNDMPWLGDAAMRVSASGDVLAAEPLREMRAQLWEHQFTLAKSTPDTQDMLGGITFTMKTVDGRPAAFPTWQCARPLTFVATMLRDPRLTEPKERAPELVKLLSALRFLRQLQVDDASAWLYSDPSKAVGGIRASVWDSSLPIDASSMTLLCVAEAIDSLDELTSPMGPPLPPTGIDKDK